MESFEGKSERDMKGVGFVKEREKSRYQLKSGFRRDFKNLLPRHRSVSFFLIGSHSPLPFCFPLFCVSFVCCLQFLRCELFPLNRSGHVS